MAQTVKRHPCIESEPDRSKGVPIGLALTELPVPTRAASSEGLLAGMLWAAPNNNDVGQAGALSLKGPEIVRVKGVLDAAALVYAPEEHGLLVPAAFYRARDGVAHQVCVNLHPEVGWRVIDLAATLVARLEGADDLRPSAAACARDYARQCQLFHAGLRESPPILHPTSVKVRWPSSPAGEQPETAGD